MSQTVEGLADVIDGAVDHVGDGLTYLAERMGEPVSERQAAAMMLLLEDQGSDVRHLLRTDRWADEDPAEDMSDDDWSALVCSACDLAASNPTTNIGWLAKRAAEAVRVPGPHQRVEQVIVDTLSVDGVELVGSYMESVCEFSGPHGPETVRLRYTLDPHDSAVVTSVEIAEP